jgi:hypothetical protein
MTERQPRPMNPANAPTPRPAPSTPTRVVDDSRELNEGRPRGQGNDAEDGKRGDGNGANHRQ